MKFGAQWSVKGIRPEARETAREAARRSGMPLGDWLNSVILQAAHGGDADDHYETAEDVGVVQSRIDDLSRRIDQLTRRGPEAYAPPQHRAAQYAPPSHVAPASFAGRLDHAVAEIAARRRALNGEMAPQPASPVMPPPVMPAPPMAPQQPPAIVRAPMPAQDLSGLEDQLRQITDSIETLRTPGVEEAIHALRGELAEIGNSLSEAMPRQAIDTIERQIQSLAARVAEGRQAGADHGALANIEQGVAEVRDALYQLTPAENLAGFGEALHGLDQKIDYIVAQKDPATLQQLEESIATLRQISAHIASDEAVGRVASDVALLAEKIDRLAHAGPAGDALSGLEQRIAALSDAIAVRNQSGAGVPPKLEALVGSLADKIEKLQGSRSDNVAFGHLEDRIVKLVEKLDASDSRLAHLEAIERGLADLLVHIEEMRAQKPSNSLREAGNGAVDGLKQDIARTQNEIQAVHGTLGQVVDRLAQIEQSMLREQNSPVPVTPGKLAVRAVSHEPPAAEPDLVPARPRESGDPADQQAAPGSPLSRGRTENVAPQPPQPPPVAASTPVSASPPVAAPAPEPPKRVMPRATSLPIDPDLPPDQPLEPGSGPPRIRLDPAARIAAAEAALGNARPAAADAPQGKSGFIAAARRAAQAALKDKTPAPGASATIDEREDADDSLRNRLSKRVKSLFVAASIIAIVVGGVQIASTHLGLFVPTAPGDQHAQTAPVEAESADSDDALQTASTPAAPGASALPGMIPQMSALGFIAPNGLVNTAPLLTMPPQTDITGSLPARSSAAPKSAAPMATAPQAMPVEHIPTAIGSAKLRNAAQRGDAGAAYEIAMRFAEGRGVATNMGEAVRWFERAAQGGLAPAQFRLGSLYEKGQGIKKDIEKARQSYLAAAAQGSAKAMHNLAVLYAEGLANKPDFAAATQWFQKAAAYGVADSQYNLAVLYARGLGGEKNLIESYKWFALAAAQGDKEAARKRDEVASQLDAKDLAAAKQAVKAWVAVPQPALATTVPQPAGGWDADKPPAAEAPKARASHNPLKIGQR